MSRAQVTLSEMRGPYLRVLESTLDWINSMDSKKPEHHAMQLRPLLSDSDDIWIRAGRGWGKSLTLVNWVMFKLFWSGVYRPRVAIVGRTGADVRQTLLESDEGLLNKLPAGVITKYDSMDNAYRLFNGGYFRLFTSEQPNSLRGPNFHFGAGDETSSWRYIEALTNFELCVRLGKNPQKLHATTPKRNDITRYLAKTKGMEIIIGKTMDNSANLSERFIARVQERFAGTHLERQELYGELLDESPGALFTMAAIEKNRLGIGEAPGEEQMERCVVSIDPQMRQSAEEEELDLGSETGIVVVCSAFIPGDTRLHYFVLGDFTVRARPAGWAAAAHEAFKAHSAHYFVAETNQGGDGVVDVLRHVAPEVPIREVHQHRGKRLRAEEVSLLYDRGLVHHIGTLSELEDQQITWTGFPGEKEKSPDRLDALVTAIAELAIDDTQSFVGIVNTKNLKP